MTQFVLRRIRDGALSLLGVVVLVFVLARMTGSPARLYLPQDASETAVAQFNHLHDLDRPIHSQLLSFLDGAAHLDFGQSLLYGRSATSVVLDRYSATLELALVAMLFAVVLGVGIGASAAARRGSVADMAYRIISVFALSVPDFWIGIMGITLFAVYLGVLPTSGALGWNYWILPLATLSLRPIGVLAQIVRTSMIDALGSDYIVVARAKGVKDRSLVYKHALRNAAIPVLTVAGVLLAQFINGALIVETVFGWPGVGNLMVTAIKGRDFSVIQAVVMVTGVAVIVVNLLIDIAYSWLDPRVRLGG